MATLAAIFKRTAAMPATVSQDWAEEYDPYQLRPLPCEDVYFFTKRIDNSRVVRETDPAARRRCWRTAAMSLASALLIMVLILPDALGMIAGYQISSLERERERLANRKAVLQAEEARLLSPEQLQLWAVELGLVDPGPKHVVYLDPKPDGSLAMRK